MSFGFRLPVELILTGGKSEQGDKSRSLGWALIHGHGRTTGRCAASALLCRPWCQQSPGNGAGRPPAPRCSWSPPLPAATGDEAERTFSTPRPEPSCPRGVRTAGSEGHCRWGISDVTKNRQEWSRNWESPGTPASPSSAHQEAQGHFG